VDHVRHLIDEDQVIGVDQVAPAAALADNVVKLVYGKMD